jgi:hypothetical protein
LHIQQSPQNNTDTPNKNVSESNPTKEPKRQKSNHCPNPKKNPKNGLGYATKLCVVKSDAAPHHKK